MQKKLSPSVANYIISNPTYYEGIAENLTGEFPFKKKARAKLVRKIYSARV